MTAIRSRRANNNDIFLDPKIEEYKDTFEFRAFPQYEYTVLQKKRLNLFQGRIEHFRKIINYADKFSQPNKINLVYMIGYSKYIKAAVMKTKTNVVVLSADISSEALEIHDKFWKLEERFVHMKKNRPFIDVDGNLTENFYDIYGEGHSDYFDIIQLSEDYKKARSEITKAFKRYIIIDKLHPEKTIDHKDLDKIIKRYFPFGREQCGISEDACKSIAKVRAAIACGSSLDLEGGYKLLGIPDNPKQHELLRKNIKRYDMDINTALRSKGYINLDDMYREMQNPPYGWDKDPHAAFCTAYALALHKDNHWLFLKCLPVPVEGNISSAIAEYFSVSKLSIRKHGICLFCEDGWRLANRLALIFDVDPVLPVAQMAIQIRKIVSNHTRIPISLIDEKLRDILVSDRELMDSRYVSDAIKYLDWDKCKKLRDHYLNINEIVVDIVKDTIPDCPEFTFDDLYECTTECSGWLWSREFTIEVFEKHIKHTVIIENQYEKWRTRYNL